MAIKMSHRKCEKDKTKIRRKIGGKKFREADKWRITRRQPRKIQVCFAPLLTPPPSFHPYLWAFFLVGIYKLFSQRNDTFVSLNSSSRCLLSFHLSSFTLLPSSSIFPSSISSIKFFHPAIIITLLLSLNLCTRNVESRKSFNVTTYSYKHFLITKYCIFAC